MFCSKQVMIGTSKNIWGFDPRSVPGCVVWLDAADSNTLTLSGSNITAWRDKSVLGNNVTSISATPPTFSSVDSSVNFTSASCNFLRGNLSDTYSNNATVFAVASITPTPELSAGVVTTFAGNGTGSYVNGTGTNATFQFPSGVTVNGSGTVYISDTWNHRIRLITPLGAVTLLAGSGTATFGDGTGAGASFSYPAQIAVDINGNAYVADTNNQRIRRITLAGVVTTFAGSGTQSSVDGTGGSATFNTPVGLTISKDNTRLFVTEANGNRIRQIVISTAVVTTVAGNGTSGATNGVGTNATFGFPIGIAPDPLGNYLYVLDPVSHRIRKIDIASGVVSTFAGSSLGTNNGTGTNAQFNYPSGVTCDENGNVYVAEADTPRIRKITPDGVVTTFAGSGTATSVDGTGTNATFSKPRGMFYYTDGIIYVVDEVGHRIRRMNTKTVNLTFPQVSSLGSNAATENNLMGQSFEMQGVTPNLLTFVENSSNPTGLGSNIQTYLSNTLLNKPLILANTSTYSGTTFGITSLLNGTTQTFTSRTGTLATNSSNVSTYNKYAIGGMLNVTATVPTSFNGKVFEYLVFNNALTTSQRQQIEGYLANKWGLSGYYFSIVPLSIPGCQLWLDAADQSSMTFSGSNITQWNDKSGNGRNATVASGKIAATYSTTLNAVNFTTSTTGYITSYPANPTNETMFVVFRNPSPSLTNNLLIGGPTGARSLGAGYTNSGGASTSSVGNLNNRVAWLASTRNTTYTAGTTALTRSHFTATSNSISLNGGTPVSGGSPNFSNGTTTYLGVDTTASSPYHYLGFAMEIIFYNSVLNTSQIEQVESYLTNKWRITTTAIYPRLSTSNPYYSVRPHLRSFQPSDIEGCQLWLDAADSSTLTLQAGNRVSAWVDKSSNAFVMSNATTLTQPTYVTSGWNGSYPGVQVNGAGSGQHNFLSNAAFNGFNTEAWDIYAVIRHSVGSTTAANYGALMWIDPSASFIIIAAGIGGSSYAILSNGGWQHAPLPGSVTTQSPYLYQEYSTGTAFGRRLNGVQPGLSEQIRAFTGVARTGTYPFFLANPSGGWATCTTHFGEMLMFNRTLLDPERLQIEGYLSTKWGLTQTSFSSTAFNPTSITGCQLWFDASDTASLTPSSITTGTKVSQWNDKSGNFRHMSNSTAASQPTYSTSNFNGSLPSVYFRGTTEVGSTNANILSNASSTVLNSTTWDIYVAFKPAGGQEAIFWNDPTSAVVLICGNTKLGGDGGENFAIHYGGWRLSPLEGACRGNECQLYQAYSTGTTLGRRVNGGFEGFMPQTSSYSWPSRSSNSELAFCRPSSGGWSEGNLAIAEVIVYNSVLSDANRSNVESYLTNKWKIGRGLQLGHPYYSFPSASIPFSLSNISGLQMWLDASDSSTVTLNGSTVSYWRDKSSNVYSVSHPTAANQPTYTSNLLNGLPGIQLTVGKFLYNLGSNIPNFTSSPSTTVLIVAKNGSSMPLNGWNVLNTVFFNGSNTQRYHLSFGINATNGVTLYVNGAPVGTTTAVAFGSNAIVGFTASASGNSINVNGTLTTYAGSTPPSANNTTWFTIGDDRTANSYISDVNIYEFVGFNRTLTTSQRQQVEGYLAQKWGLTSFLPSSHPFRKIPTAPARTSVLETALSYLPLDTDSRDIGINPQVITTNGTVTYTTIAGRQCAYFNNSLNNYISFPYTNKNSFTICFWLSPFNTTFWTAISITLVTSGVAQSADSPGFQLDITGTSIIARVRMPNRWTNSHSVTAGGVGNWAHYAITVNQVTFVSQLYTNGVFTSTLTGTGTGVSVRNTFFIGRSGDISRAYNGYVTKFAFFDRVLSAPEISEIFMS
jgi:sugar lactone lactonase YvrE